MSHPRILAALLLSIAVGRTGVAMPPVLGGGPERSAQLSGALADTLKRVGSAQKGPFWLAWEVAAAPSLRNACCFDDGSRRSPVCRLEGPNHGWSTNRDSSPVGTLQVLARWSDGKVQRARAVSDECTVDTGGLPLVHLPGVAAAESVALLAGLVGAGSWRGDADEVLAALAYHGDHAADEALQRLAARGEPSDLREKALFWIGQARGEEGAGVARTDPDPEIREKALFSLSQNDAPGAVPAIVEVARHDSSAEVRGQALFWLAQTGAAVASQVILERLDKDPPVREKAVFAITQLQGGQSVPLLVRLVRERRDPEIRKQALFWLGQSNDPRALDFLEKILDP